MYKDDLISTKIATQLSLRAPAVAEVIKLFADGNTVPFVARYRKEATGGLDEVELRAIHSEHERISSLEERRESILRTIEEQGNLTEDLRRRIELANTQTELEDLYQPYRPKRKTRASVARERGLEPLARMILEQATGGMDLNELGRIYLSADLITLEDVWQGARDIVAETISDQADVRRVCREKAYQWGRFVCEKVSTAVDERKVYAGYYQYEQRVDRLLPHQVLAINRGEKEGVLHAKVLMAERDWREAIFREFTINPASPLGAQLRAAAEDAAERLLLPAIERDVRRSLTESAERHAINVFGANLRALLNQPPLRDFTVLGIDPGFRTGCKIAIVDPTGKVLETGTIYPHPPQQRWVETLDKLKGWLEKFKVNLISIGNGTASRETEQLVAELIHEVKDLKYIITNEAGASVYSASDLARQEFPELDVSLRGAVSIARRVQDPLAELVKIDPKSIGIGLYQHDVDQKALNTALQDVVESVVNQVGVELNTASPALLQFVSGIGPKLAQAIVANRDTHGPYPNRSALRAVRGLGPKAFEQAAGFLRVRESSTPLDNSAIHPESYPIAEQVLKQVGIRMDLPGNIRSERLDSFVQRVGVDKLAVSLKVGRPTLEDILDQLKRPGRDPRENLPRPILRQDVLKMEDLTPGISLQGTVRNVVDFGAFVDIGVKQDGLLHRSQIPQKLSLSVGDVVTVTILQVEIERGRISLGWNQNTATGLGH